MREKLIELLDEASFKLKELCGGYNDGTGNTVRADHLIANGVTVTDNNVGDKWIPVTERLPEDVYGKDREKIVVLVCTKSGNVSQCARVADYDCSTEYSTEEEAIVAWNRRATDVQQN